MKNYSQQEIITALNAAPHLIQDGITGSNTLAIIVELQKKYKLHIDQIGKIAELNRNMLLGLVGPDEFLKDLIEAKIPEKDAREIMTEINQKIFVSLREKMRSGGVPAPTRPVMPQTRPQVSTPPAPPRHIINKIQNPVVGEKLLEDHEEPHIEFAKAPMTPPVSRPTPIALAPRPVMPPPPQPRPMTPPPNLPGAPRPSEAFGGRGMPPVPPPPQRPVVLVKPYSSDPYREPIDGKE